MTTIHICTELNLDNLDFEDLMDRVVLNDGWGDVPVLESDNLPCYMGFIRDAQLIPTSAIPAALELAMRDIANEETLLMVSMTSREDGYQAWVDIARDYPGGVVTEITRKDHRGTPYTVYNLLFPGTPTL